MRDLCNEAGLVAEGSISGVLDGRHYNWAVRVYKCIYEAFMRLALAEFMVWVENDFKNSVMVNTFVKKVDGIACLNQQKYDKLLNSKPLAKLMTLWDKFTEHLHHDNGELSAYWMTYVDIIENVVLGLLRSSRERNCGVCIFMQSKS